MEKYEVTRATLFMVFVDLKKAFHYVLRKVTGGHGNEKNGGGRNKVNQENVQFVQKV